MAVDRHRRSACVAALNLIGRWVLNPLFRILANAQAREVMTAAALLVVLGAALLFQFGGLSMAMGAFLAGVLLSTSTFRHQLEADIEPFRGILLGLFFLAVGMSLDINIVAANWQIIALSVVAYMVIKGGAIFVLGQSAGGSSFVPDALERALLDGAGRCGVFSPSCCSPPRPPRASSPPTSRRSFRRRSSSRWC